MSQLTLTLFGPPRLWREGTVLRGRAAQKKRLALLTLLAGSPDVTATRDRLVGLLWSDSDPGHARRLLTEATYVIRSEVDDELIETVGDSLVLETDRIQCDLWRFREAAKTGDHETVLAISVHPLLEGWYLDDAPDFQHWCDALRAEVEATVERAIRALAAADELAGRWNDAAAHWRRATRLDPLRSEFVLNLARALERTGESGPALTALRAHETALLEQLEVGPDSEVVAMVERLRSQRRPTPPSIHRVEPGPVAPAPVDEVPPRTHEPRTTTVRPRHRRWTAPAVVALALLLAAAIGLAAYRPADPTLRIAVRYIEDLSPDRAMSAIADELTLAVITHLTAVDAFEVFPASASGRLRDLSVSLDSVRSALKATHLVEGWINLDGQRPIGAVSLRDARTGRVLDTKRFEQDPRSLVDLRDEIARQVAAMIRVRVGRDVRLREIRWGSRNSRAFTLVAGANQALAAAEQLLRATDAGAPASAASLIHEADSLFDEAGAEDKKWFAPVVGHARAALLFARVDTSDQRDARLAAALDRLHKRHHEFADEPAYLEACGALRWQRVMLAGPSIDTIGARAAIRDLNAAVTLEPGRARSLSILAKVQFLLGEYARAQVTAERALNADAWLEEAPDILRMLFAATLFQSRLEESARWCARGRREEPTDWWFVECEITLIKYRTDARPDLARARRLVALADSLDPPHLAKAAGHAYSPLYRRLILAAVAVRAGDLEAGRTALSAARDSARGDPELEIDMVPEEITILELLQEHDRARALLMASIAKRPLLRVIAERDPLLRPVLRQAAP